MISGITRSQPRVGLRDDRDHGQHADAQEGEPSPDQAGRAALARALPGEQGGDEHGQRQRRQREAGLQRVVLQVELEVDRQRDHQPAQGDVLQDALPDAEVEELLLEEIGVEERGLALALPPDQPAEQRNREDDAGAHQQAHRLAALLPGQDAEHEQAHAEHRQRRADRVDAAVAGEGDVADQAADPARTPRDDERLDGEARRARRAASSGNRRSAARSRRRSRPPRRSSRRPSPASCPRSCRGSGTAWPAGTTQPRGRRASPRR